MRNSVPASDVRQPATSGRTVSQPERFDKLPRRAASQSMRLSATEVEAINESGLDIEIVRSVMERRQVLVKQFAINAGVSRSQVSEALAGAAGRSLSFAWVLRQDAEFVAEVMAETNRRLGLTSEGQRQQSFDAVVELLRSVWFRERREERVG